MNGGLKTQAAVLTALKKPLQVVELDVPDLQAGQVLVKIAAAGVCRTQLNEWYGIHGPDKYLPHLMGHEASGTVKEVGKGVKHVKPGDFVVLSWVKGQGLNVGGGTYTWGKKQVNSGGVAVFTDYAVVSENRVTKIPKSLPVEVAALLGCAVATGVGVVRNTLEVTPGSTVAVFGVGGVGAAAILGSVLQKAKEIIAVDVSPKKLAWAKKLGATKTVNSKKQNPVEAIQKLTNGGVDFAVEASGIPAVGEQAFAALNDHGTLAIAGHPATGSVLKLDPFSFIKGKKVVGTWGGGTVPHIDFPFYAGLYKRGDLPLNKLITHRFGLSRINKALEVLDNGSAGRVIIDFLID